MQEFLEANQKKKKKGKKFSALLEKQVSRTAAHLHTIQVLLLQHTAERSQHRSRCLAAPCSTRQRGQAVCGAKFRQPGPRPCC